MLFVWLLQSASYVPSPHTKPSPLTLLCSSLSLSLWHRHKLGWDNANSTEFDKDTKKPVVVIMSEIDPRYMGGTMRLGAKETVVTTAVNGEETLASKVYGGKSGTLSCSQLIS